MIDKCVGESRKAKLRRIRAQMLQNASVIAQAEIASRQSQTRLMMEYRATFKERAAKFANSNKVSAGEAKYAITHYKCECNGGGKWASVLKAFGGSGIAVVFVIAGKRSCELIPLARIKAHNS